MDNPENSFNEETTYQSDNDESDNESLGKDINDESEYESDDESLEEDINLENLDFLRFFDNCNENDFLKDEDTDEDTQNNELPISYQHPMETRVRLNKELFIEDVD